MHTLPCADGEDGVLAERLGERESRLARRKSAASCSFMSWSASEQLVSVGAAQLRLRTLNPKPYTVNP